MENKTAAILVLAIVAALVVTVSGAYAMGRQTPGVGSSYPYAGYASGMGGSFGYPGGMMGGYGANGGYGMMGEGNGQYSMWQYMSHFWNSTSVP